MPIILITIDVNGSKSPPMHFTGRLWIFAKNCKNALNFFLQIPNKPLRLSREGKFPWPKEFGLVLSAIYSEWSMTRLPSLNSRLFNHHYVLIVNLWLSLCLSNYRLTFYISCRVALLCCGNVCMLCHIGDSTILYSVAGSKSHTQNNLNANVMMGHCLEFLNHNLYRCGNSGDRR